MPFNLYIDTSGVKSTILLFDENNNIAIRHNEIQNDHSKFINLHIEEAMNELNITWSNLKSICVLNGPGSYTGLRISLATAKGIAYAHSIPLILINKLDLLASTIYGNNDFAVIIKAREKEYYFGLYDSTSKLLQENSMISEDDLLQFSTNRSYIFYSPDTEVLIDNIKIETILLTKNDIINCCNTQIHLMNWVDLFISEPFYMKNVYINK